MTGPFAGRHTAAFLALAALLALSPAPAAGAGRPAGLVVHVVGPAEAGRLVFQLYDRPNAFGDLRDPLVTFRRPAGEKVPHLLEGITAGEYALVVFHDANGNGHLDRNFIGIPLEPVGFSSGYRPKGPPVYGRASFTLAEGEEKALTVRLDRPLGDRGRPGLGLGIIVRSSPYRGEGGGSVRPIPSVSYVGRRLQILGPNVQLGLAGFEKFSLALTARPRFGAYDEDDTPALEGLGDRRDTVMAGVAVAYEMPWGIEITAGYEHDLLGRIGGGAARLALEKTFQAGVIRLTPAAGLNWLAADLSRHDFGVPGDAAREDRPAYDPGAAVSGEVGLGAFIELSRSWLLIASASVEFLDSSAADSPIVDEERLFKAFSALNYVF